MLVDKKHVRATQGLRNLVVKLANHMIYTGLELRRLIHLTQSGKFGMAVQLTNCLGDGQSKQIAEKTCSDKISP